MECLEWTTCIISFSINIICYTSILYSRYKKFITGQISGNLQQAQRGGVPGTYNLVRSYLNIRQATLPRGLEVNIKETKL